jgi:hypothetical protein
MRNAVSYTSLFGHIWILTSLNVFCFPFAQSRTVSDPIQSSIHSLDILRSYFFEE